MVEVCVFVSGGNAPALVTTVQTLIGGPHSLKYTLLLMYPAMYAVAAVLFALALLCVGVVPEEAPGIARIPIAAGSTRYLVGALEGDIEGVDASTLLLSPNSKAELASLPTEK